MNQKKFRVSASARENKLDDVQSAESSERERSNVASHADTSAATPSHLSSPPPSPDDVKARLLAERRRGPDRPLRLMARREAELQAQSAALPILERRRHKRNPDRKLLLHQVQVATNPTGVTSFERPEMRREAIALAAALEAEDAMDSIFVRQIVALSNSAMECHARAAEHRDPKLVDVYLRHAEKCTMVLIALSEARDRRRSPKQILISNLNVGAGGRAIVGTVEAPSQSRVTADQVTESAAAGTEQEHSEGASKEHGGG